MTVAKEKKTSGRRRNAEKTKAQIIKAATALFTTCGLNGASLDDISRKAGVNRGLIYHYFKTKEFLFDQVLARPLAIYAQSHLGFLQREQCDVETLADATASFFRFLGEHPELVRLLGWTLAMRRMAADFAQLEFTRALYARAIKHIAAGQADGVLRRDMDPHHLLITVIDLCVAWHLSRTEWIEKLSWGDREDKAIDEERLAAILDFVSSAVEPRVSETRAEPSDT